MGNSSSTEEENQEEEGEAEDAPSCCASCGKEETAPGKHKACSRCKSVIYCGPVCQRQHWPVHKTTCTKKAKKKSSLSSSPPPPPSSSSSPSDAAPPATSDREKTSSVVDPRTLKAWAHVNKRQACKPPNGDEEYLKGLTEKQREYIQSDIVLSLERAAAKDVDNGALYEAFESAMPQAIRRSLIVNMDSKLVSMTPEAEFLFSLIHAWSSAYNREKDCYMRRRPQAMQPKVDYRGRYAFHDPDEKEMLLLDVHAVLTCPEDGSVPHGPPSDDNAKDNNADATATHKPFTTVTLRGLSRPELNGATGIIRSFDSKTLRYRVELYDDGLGGGGGGGGFFNIKHENIVAVAFRYQKDAPMVVVRYLHRALSGAGSLRKSLEPFQVGPSASFSDGWLGDTSDMNEVRNMMINCTASESLQDVRAGLAELQRNEKALSPEYTAHFRALSKQNRSSGGREGGFRPSFLVPPAHVPARNRLAKECFRCARPGCGQETADVKAFTNCSACKSALYCSKPCQREHWKSAHKFVCGKSAAEIEAAGAAAAGEASTSADGRESFVMDIDCCPAGIRHYPPGWVREKYRRSALAEVAATGEENFYRMNVNLNHGGDLGIEAMNAVRDVPMYKNVYGDEEFVVKIQVPTGSTGDGSTGGCAAGLPARCMLYDKGKTFGDQYFDCDSAVKRRVFQLIVAKGAARGLKGFFAARRLGGAIRVYTDRMLPFPKPAF